MEGVNLNGPNIEPEILPGVHALLERLTNKDIKEAITDVDETESAIDKEELKVLAEDWRQELLAKSDKSNFNADQGVLILYGAELVEDPHIMDVYDDIEHNLHGLQGQPLLVKRQWLDNGTSPLNLKFELMFGVIDGEHLRFDINELTAGLPTGMFLLNTNDPIASPTNPIESRPGPILVTSKPSGFDLVKDLNRPLGTTLTAGGEKVTTAISYPALEIACGYDAIHEWLGVGDDGLEARLEYIDLASYEHHYKTIKYMANLLRVDGIRPTNSRLQKLDASE